MERSNAAAEVGQLGDAVDVDQPRWTGKAEVEQRDEALAPGKGL